MDRREGTSDHGTDRRRPTIARLRIGDRPRDWTRLGFSVHGNLCRVGTVGIELVGPEAGEGILGWALRDTSTAELDGLPTDLLDEPPQPPGSHPNGAAAIDHVVVITPSLDRTAAALDDARVLLRRVREAGSPSAPMRQGFFRLGEVILEVVSAAPVTVTPAGESAPADAPATGGTRQGSEAGGLPHPGPAEPARFWGMVFVVSELERCAEVLGRHLGAPRDAVQAGRRIATLKRSAGLSLPVAFITPPPRPGSEARPSAPEAA